MDTDQTHMNGLDDLGLSMLAEALSKKFPGVPDAKAKILSELQKAPRDVAVQTAEFV